MPMRSQASSTARAFVSTFAVLATLGKAMDNCDMQVHPVPTQNLVYTRRVPPPPLPEPPPVRDLGRITLDVLEALRTRHGYSQQAREKLPEVIAAVLR